MENLIVIIVISAIITGAARYLYRSKKRGEKCVGCPYAKQCSSKNCGKKSILSQHKSQ